MTRDQVRDVVVLREPKKWVGRFVCSGELATGRVRQAGRTCRLQNLRRRSRHGCLYSCGGTRVACEVAAKGGSARPQGLADGRRPAYSADGLSRCACRCDRKHPLAAAQETS